MQSIIYSLKFHKALESIKIINKNVQNQVNFSINKATILIKMMFILKSFCITKRLKKLFNCNISYLEY